MNSLIVLSFNHCSLDQLKMLNHSLTTGGMESAIFTQERGFNICSRTLICRQLFAGHVVGSRLMKRKGKIDRMMISIILSARGTKRVGFQSDAHGKRTVGL